MLEVHKYLCQSLETLNAMIESILRRHPNPLQHTRVFAVKVSKEEGMFASNSAQGVRPRPIIIFSVEIRLGTF